jgi:hypothetical protein
MPFPSRLLHIAPTRRHVRIQASIVAAACSTHFGTRRLCSRLAALRPTFDWQAALSNKASGNPTVTQLHCLHDVCLQLYGHRLCPDAALSVLLVVLSCCAVSVVECLDPPIGRKLVETSHIPLHFYCGRYRVFLLDLPSDCKEFGCVTGLPPLHTGHSSAASAL